MTGKFQYKSVVWLIISILSSPGHFVIYYVSGYSINYIKLCNILPHTHSLHFYFIIEFQTVNLLKTCTFVFLEMSKIITKGQIKSLTFLKSLLRIKGFIPEK